MPRDHARILTAIWSDDEFCALPAAAQRVYMLLLTQDGLTYAGTQDLRVNRWASRAPDTTPEDIRAALAVLEAARFVVIDEVTEESLVRSYLRINEVWKQPKLLTLALRQVAAVQSRRIRHELRKELLRLPDDPRADAARTLAGTLPRTPGDTPPRTLPGTPAGTPGDTPAEALPEGSRAHAGARVTRNPEPEHGRDGTTSGGDLTSVDAGAREQDDAAETAVPGTRPAPLEEHPHDEAPPAPVHENAMPPARCRNHLELADPPPCGRCADARRAQEAWIADRDAKVAESRAQAQAEIRREKDTVRAAIDACKRCSDRGVHLATGLLCTHDDAADEAPGTGRAEARAAREALRQRAAARAQTGDQPKRATSEQLAKIAILYDRMGKDRDARLDDMGQLLGRELTTMTGLTRVEASYVIDRWEAPPPAPDEPPDEPVVVMDPAVRQADGHEWTEPPIVGPAPLPEVGSDPSTAAGGFAGGDVDPEFDDEDLPPGPDEDDATGGFEDEYRADQQTWAEADEDVPDYVYAGGPDDPPF